jgi:uncharacterized protein (DUF433 family)
MKKIEWGTFIHSDPSVLLGKPVVKGTRLSIEFILGLYAEGWTEDQILANYPNLTKESLLAVFAYTHRRPFPPHRSSTGWRTSFWERAAAFSKGLTSRSSFPIEHHWKEFQVMKQQKWKVREDVRDLPLKVKAEMALKESVAEALAEHKRQGNPIAIWRYGKAVWIPPEEIVVPDV